MARVFSRSRVRGALSRSRTSWFARRLALNLERLEDRALLAVTASVSDASLVEGDFGTANMEFTVQLSEPRPDVDTVLNYVITDGTTTAEEDYFGSIGSVAFPAGVTEQTISVPIVGDPFDELDEQFLLDLSNPAAGTLDQIDAPNIGAGSSNPNEFIEFNGAVYFVAEDAAHGRELWKYDGETVSLAADIYLGAPSSSPGYLTVWNNALYFSAYTSDASGEIWRFDGTTATRVTDFIKPQFIDSRQTELTVYKNELYFATNYNFNGHRDLFKLRADHTAVQVGNLYSQGSDEPGWLTVYNDLLVFRARNSLDNIEMWTYNGSTLKQYDIWPGSAGSQAALFTEMNGILYFTATGFNSSGQYVGRELFQFDGQTVSLAADIRPFDGSGTPENLVAYNGALYFIAHDRFDENGDRVREFWKYDGQVARPVLSETPYFAGKGAYAVFNNDLYFSHQDDQGQITLKRFDGRHLIPVLDRDSGSPNANYSLRVIGDQLFFRAGDDSLGAEMWTLTPDVIFSDGRAVGTILDDDEYTVSASNITVVEGDAGTTDAVFTVRLSTPATAPISVDYQTQDVTANGQDYDPTMGTLTFQPGEQELTVAVPILGDTAAEVDETFHLRLFNGQGATVIGDPVTATILNDDTKITIDDVTVAEGDFGQTTARLTVRLSQPHPVELRVNYTVSPGTATEGADGDYEGSPGEVIFAPDQTISEVTIPVWGDNVWERDETFFVNLAPVSGAVLLDGQGKGTITNDDAVPELTVSDPTVVEGDSGSTPAVFTMTLSHPSSENILIYWETFVSDATPGADYVHVASSVNFAPGETEKQVTVDVLGDTLDEGDERFLLRLAALNGATSDDIYSTATIIDDDPTTTELRITDAQVIEGHSGTQQVALTVTLSEPTGRPVTVDYATANGTAVAGVTTVGDYLPATGRLTFDPGETQKTINVVVAGDVQGEADEDFLVNLSNLVGALLADDSARVTIIDDDQPVARDDFYPTLEDQALVIPAAPGGGNNLGGVLWNDTDPNGQTLTARLIQDPEHGTLSLQADGSFTYTPAADYVGADSFVYEADDGNGGVAQARATITISGTDDPPVAEDVTAATAEDTAVTGALIATDPDNQPLTFEVVAGPSHGGVVLNGGAFTYTPAANYAGGDSFTYRAYDGHSYSNTATVQLTVTPVNDAPVATNVDVSTPEDTSLLGQLEATDLDGDALTYEQITGPAQGVLVLNSNGSYTYRPASNFTGNVFFTFRATDGAAVSNTATVQITVTPVNDAPVAHGFQYGMDEDTVFTNTVQGTDVDGDALTYTLVPDSGPSVGSLDFQADGNFTYQPPANFNGVVSFRFQASDGVAVSNMASIYIAVRPVNDAPRAISFPDTLDEDTVLVRNLEYNDIDGSTVDFWIVDLPAHGAIELTGAIFTYTPDPDYHGPDSFTFQVRDNGGLESNVGVVSLTVLPINDAPAPGDDAYTLDEDTALTVAAPGVLANDADVDGDALTATLAAPAAHGVVTLAADGSFTYTPDANYHGPDQFTYTVSDGQGAPVLATVTLTVAPVNDLPTAANDTATGSEDVNLVIDVLANDADPDGDALTVQLLTDPEHGTVTLAADGTLAYDPDTDYFGNDSFTYRVSDGVGTSTVATVSVFLAAQGETPVIDITPFDPSANVINLKNSEVAVAILSSESFDAAAQVNVASLTFGRTGGEQSLVTHKKHGPKYELRDVNGDGRLDVVAYFKPSSTGLTTSSTLATLRGELHDGSAFSDSDAVQVINSKGGGNGGGGGGKPGKGKGRNR